MLDGGSGLAWRTTNEEETLVAASATPAGGRVTRGNWLAAPFNRLAFQRVDTILPVAAVSRGLGPERKLENAPDDETIDRIVYEVGTSRSTIGDFLRRSSTDGSDCPPGRVSRRRAVYERPHVVDMPLAHVHLQVAGRDGRR